MADDLMKCVGSSGAPGNITGSGSSGASSIVPPGNGGFSALNGETEMTTHQKAQASWIEWHKGIDTDLLPEMSPSFLAGFRAGYAAHKGEITEHVTETLQKWQEKSNGTVRSFT